MTAASLLFVCETNGAPSLFAQLLLQSMAPETLRVCSAGICAGEVDAMALHIAQNQGLSVDGFRPQTVAALGNCSFDLLITLCRPAQQSCPLMPGAPAVLHWEVENPALVEGSPEQRRQAYLRCFERIRLLLQGLVEEGYLDALIRLKSNTDSILNALSEGVLAHDLNRKIFYFSAGAERLTGFSAAQVLGKDCHELFSPNLCGQNCSFCNPQAPFIADQKQYSTAFVSGTGNRREVDVTVVPLRQDGGGVQGVVAAFRDRTEVKALQRQSGLEHRFQGILGSDTKMQQLFELIADLGQCDFPVTISGESGTGKELVARAIHAESVRRSRTFVPVNCGALPEGTLESELFGHMRGAFTGAVRDKKGRFELADEGTLFLDEVAELSLPMQVKLLRVLQEGTFEPLGSEVTKKVDVRIICATNRNLKQMVEQGSFREDLYYRLAVVPIQIPPLRERRSDIVLLASSFLREFGATLGRKGLSFADETIDVMIAAQWPGNVRQLQNAIQYSLIKCRGNTVMPHHLPPELLHAAPVPLTTALPLSRPRAGRKPVLTVAMVQQALATTDGNKAKAARQLGVGRATLYNFIASQTP